MSDAEPMDGIAVVGMSCRFPGAESPRQFFENLCEGAEGITFLSEADLEAAGVQRSTLEDPAYVRAASSIDGIENFDAPLFGVNPREAEIMDPQQRLFLEGCWEALEAAGHDSLRFPGRIGVYGGGRISDYLLANLRSNPDALAAVGLFQALLLNDKDYLTTHVSYRLDLKGPSVCVQTACSTSLVAVHFASEALLSNECDMALAGGVAVRLPQKRGYRFMEGGVVSSDGHCRSFDARAEGTVFGDGVGIVVLRRLEDALEDGDHVYAVIKGSAINNDGGERAGFTAPGVAGQAAVIAEALEVAGFEPQTVGHIEAHGTATAIGDLIEFEALQQAFGRSPMRPASCAMSSVKSNVGHLETAAGVAGLIKTVWMLEHKKLVPSLHFEQPNPRIDFGKSPFFINTELADWPASGQPRRAGVSSFGIGGTNAHVLLEEAPAAEASGPGRPWQLLTLSAKSPAALERMTERLAGTLGAREDLDLADAAFTLKTGRRKLEHRRILVCRTREEAAEALAARDPQRVLSRHEEREGRPVIFLFPGQGAQYVGMARELYAEEAAFREVVDDCCRRLESRSGLDLLPVLYPEGSGEGLAGELAQTRVAQPALFVIEYALARLLMDWGVEPKAMVGHSVGELVAACLAGVLPLEEALDLVAARGELMQRQPSGAMLSVHLPAAELEPLLRGGGVEIAALNGEKLTVASGSESAVERLAGALADRGVEHRKLHTSHAFHSAMMEEVVAPFRERVERVRLRPPRIPVMSNLSGRPLTPEEATDPAYWGRHVRETVRFVQGLERCLENPEAVLLEVGPGSTLSTLARQHSRLASSHTVLSSLPHPKDAGGADRYLAEAVGRLWMAGVSFDWNAYYRRERRRRISLPTYPFDKRKFWVEPGRSSHRAPAAGAGASPLQISTWARDLAPPPRPPSPAKASEEGRGGCLLLAREEDGLGRKLARELKRYWPRVTTCWGGDVEEAPGTVVFLSAAGAGGGGRDAAGTAGEALEELRALVSRLAAWSRRPDAERPAEIVVVTRGARAIHGGETQSPLAAPLLGLLAAVPWELPELDCRSVDLPSGDPDDPSIERSVALAAVEIAARPPERVVLYRGGERWLQAFEASPAPDGSTGIPGDDQVFLVWNHGAAEVGEAIESALAAATGARLAVLTPPDAPARPEWEEWLAREPPESAARRRIEHLRGLEGRGAKLLPLPEPALSGELAQTLEAAEERWGRPVDGVVYLGSTLGGGLPRRRLDEGDTSDLEAAVLDDLERLRSLAATVAARKLDLCVVVTSLAAVSGGPGSAAAACAASLGSAFARSMDREGRTRWRCVSWSMDAGLASQLAALPADLTGPLLRFFLSPESPAEIFVSPDALRYRLDAESVRAAGVEESGDPAADVAGGHDRPDVTTAYVAPRGDLERRIAALWEEALGISGVGVFDDFLELGGHSLLITRMAGRLRAALEVEVAPADLFEAGTIAGQAVVAVCRRADRLPPGELEGLLEELGPAEGGSPEIAAGTGAAELVRGLPAEKLDLLFARLGQLQEGTARVRIPRRPDSERLPLSFAQQRLWYLDRLDPGSVAYNFPLLFELEGRVDPAVLERCLNDLVRRHESLRTRFEVVDGEPLQRIEPALVLPLPVLDLAAVPADVGEARADRLAGKEAKRSFDLSTGPLLRAMLFRLREDRHLVLLNMHHIITDVWSMQVLLRELAELYAARSKGVEPALPELPIQYADFACWQRDWLEGDHFAEQLEYWKAQLGGDEPPRLELSIETRRKTGGAPQRGGGRRKVHVDGSVLADLKALGVEESSSLFMVLFACFNTLLHCYSKQTDFLVGTPIASRDRPELEGLIGFLANTVVLRTDLSGDPTFRELLGRVRRVVLGAQAHQDVPFEKVVEAVRPGRDRELQPLFDVLFVLHSEVPAGRQAAARPQLTLKTRGVDTGEARYDLVFDLWQSGEDLGGAVEFRRRLFSDAAVERLVGDLARVAGWAAAAPDAPLADFRRRFEELETSRRERERARARDLQRATLRKVQRRPIEVSGTEA